MTEKFCVPLRGRFVVLEPLTRSHVDGLEDAVTDGELWQLWYASVPSPKEMTSYVDVAIKASINGNMAFAVRNLKTQQIVGTTRFYNVEPAHKRGLIGYTWYAKSAQGTAINTEAIKS
jgi:RimJ/RimL family protein N-acetyltransferase